MHDMDKLKNLKMLDAGAPDAMKAFWEFDKAVFKDGAISALNKQLIAVAVALTTQCAYCIARVELGGLSLAQRLEHFSDGLDHDLL